jgi:hypothetical protein
LRIFSRLRRDLNRRLKQQKSAGQNSKGNKSLPSPYWVTELAGCS